MTEPLTQALEQRQAQEKAPTVFDLLDRMTPELEKALPKHLRAERFARLVTTELRRTPKLLECNPQSLLGAMMLSAQLGLEPGPLGHVYLVPFAREVTFIVGYRGYIELAYRSGQVKDIDAGLVYEGEPFTNVKGSHPKLVHEPMVDPGDAEIVASYAIARLKTGGTVWVVTGPFEWERARKSSPAGAKGVGPWADDRPQMIRKTSVRRLESLLPKSPAWLRAETVDEQPAPPVADVPVVEDGDEA